MVDTCRALNMNEQTVNLTYEAITNPILRLMLYFLAAAVVALCGAVAYMYREIRGMQREMLTANYDAIHALDTVADAVNDLRNDVATIAKRLPQ